MPVAVYGVLLASVGALDAFNDATADLKTPLFPNEEMARSSTGGLPSTNNSDVTILFVEIKNDTLFLRMGYKEKLGAGTSRVSQLLREDGVFSTIFNIGWPDFDGKYIQPCKLVKFPRLVPVAFKAQDLTTLSQEVLYNKISDGQLLSDSSGTEALYDTLKDAASAGTTELLTWKTGEVNTILLHAYQSPDSRQRGVVRVPGSRVPGSRVFVLRLPRCWIDVADKKRSSMSTNRRAEDDVWDLMAKNAGYAAYSWKVNALPFAYTADNLVGAKVKYNGDDNSHVYIVSNGIIPWQRVAKKGES